MDAPLIIKKLNSVIQTQVSKNFGMGRPTVRGIETVREYAQDLLNVYMKEIIKESPELQRQWPLGHPFVIHSRISPTTRTYEIVITTKDNPKAL